MNANRFNWQPLAALALLYFGINPALKYGGIWELQAHPVDGVTVKLHDGRELQGTLTRVWSGDWLLFASGGASIQFNDHAYDWLQFTPPDTRPTLTAMLVTKWREHFLFFLMSVGASVLAITGIAKSRGHERAAQPPTTCDSNG